MIMIMSAVACPHLVRARCFQANVAKGAAAPIDIHVTLQGLLRSMCGHMRGQKSANMRKKQWHEPMHILAQSDLTFVGPNRLEMNFT